jgi:hypothetical protein
LNRFYLADHQGKGYPYGQALEEKGWQRVVNAAELIQLALYDMDAGDKAGWRRGLDMLHTRGVPVMIYPHAARPSLFWDGMYEVWPHTRAFIAIAEGHREIMQIYGYPLPIEVCGWAMCELRDWQPVEVRNPVKVLFAPIHPNRNGWLHPTYRAYNTIVFQKLLETPGIHLTIRHIMSLALNGIWQAPGVQYMLGTTKPATEQIDEADVVISHQTFAFLAVARGKPLIMMGDDMRAIAANSWDNMRWVAHYDDYRELLRYPLEAEAARSGRGLRAMIEQACSENVGAEWRERLIGRPFDPKHFVKTVESYL